MKKILSILTLLLLMPFVLAQETTTTQSAGLTANSVFYQADLTLEKIQLFFTLDDLSKVQKQTRFNEERLSEIEKLSLKNKDYSTKIIKTQQLYEKQLIKAEEKASTINNNEDRKLALMYLNAKSQQHLLILNNLKGIVPSQAVSGIDTAINSSTRYKDRVKMNADKIDVMW